MAWVTAPSVNVSVRIQFLMFSVCAFVCCMSVCMHMSGSNEASVKLRPRLGKPRPRFVSETEATSVTLFTEVASVKGVTEEVALDLRIPKR